MKVASTTEAVASTDQAALDPERLEHVRPSDWRNPVGGSYDLVVLGGDDSFGRHQVGGWSGGPIARDRLFYFADAEITREREDAVLTSPLAIGLARQGCLRDRSRGAAGYTKRTPRHPRRPAARRRGPFR